MKVFRSERLTKRALRGVLQACPYQSLIGVGLTEAEIKRRRPAAVYASPDLAPGDPPVDMLADLALTLSQGRTIMIMARDPVHRDRMKMLVTTLADQLQESEA